MKNPSVTAYGVDISPFRGSKTFEKNPALAESPSESSGAHGRTAFLREEQWNPLGLGERDLNVPRETSPNDSMQKLSLAVQKTAAIPLPGTTAGNE